MSEIRQSVKMTHHDVVTSSGLTLSGFILAKLLGSIGCFEMRLFLVDLCMTEICFFSAAFGFLYLSTVYNELKIEQKTHEKRSKKTEREKSLKGSPAYSTFFPCNKFLANIATEG